MGIQPRNATTAQGALQRLQALGPSSMAPGTDTKYRGAMDRHAANRKWNEETWGSGQKGAPNYNSYMDRSNRNNYSPNGRWRGRTPSIGFGQDSAEQIARFGLGGTGPDPKVLERDARDFAQQQEWNATQRKYARPHSTMSPGVQMGGKVGDMLAAHRRMNTAPPGMNTTQTPGIYVPGQKPAPHYDSDETPSDNSIPTPPTTKPTQPGGLGGMPASTPGNPLMNTMKPKQKPKFGTLGANRGMNGMGLGPNSVAKPGVYGTY